MHAHHVDTASRLQDVFTAGTIALRAVVFHTRVRWKAPTGGASAGGRRTNRRPPLVSSRLRLGYSPPSSS